MSDHFGPREILELAVNVEENGESLYAALEKKASHEALKQMWCYLKEQEKIHGRIFKDMINKSAEQAFDYGSGDYGAYFKTIADNYIITSRLVAEKKQALFPSDLDAVEFGIYIEKESILTYGALRDYCPQTQRKAIDAVIREEQEHFVRLSRMREILKKGA